MQSRSKWWIITIVLLFVLSFLYAFQPLRLAPKVGFEVQSTFRFTFPEPPAQGEDKLAAKAAEIQTHLTQQGIELDHVKFVGPNELEVETLALDEAQATQDQQRVSKSLLDKYPGLQQIGLGRDQEKEQPLSTLGPFALYKPKPQVRLGLDLLGGAHVVLRALPETWLKFEAPEDKPLSQTAEVFSGEPKLTSEGKPITPSAVTPEMLTERLTGVLVRGGTPVDEIEVSIPADNMVSVRTRAKTKDIANKQQKLLQSHLEGAYVGVTITAKEAESVFLEAETAEKVRSVIDRRLYQMSDIREPVIQVQGDDRLIVEMPGVRDPERVVGILRSTAMLEFRLIPDRYTPSGAEQSDYSEWQDKQGQSVTWERVLTESEAEFTGRDLMSNSRVETDSTGQWVVHFELRADRKNAFRQFTRRNVGRLMAIVLDRQCQMAPVIKSEIPGAGIIEGGFTAQEARDLKLLLNAGALPVPLEVAENRTISASLGASSVQKSLYAGFIGLALVLLFMLAYYRLPGLLADISLSLYILVVLAVLVFTKTVLTLPGIAGIILSIGMAVDANVIIFERLREELWTGKSMRAAIEAGFERAWTAIVDANITTLIVAAVLYFMGTSSIKSFAVTLFVGVLCSLLTAVTVTRWLVTMVGNLRAVSSNPRWFGATPETN